MIRDEAVAKQALGLMEDAQTQLMKALDVVREKCAEGESNDFLSAIAQIKGQLFFDVMEPVYRLHPSLAPSETPKGFIDRWSNNVSK